MKSNVSYIKNCYGCGVCSKSCTKKIIDIRLNSDGFYEPYITDESKCNECGLCLDVCAYNYETPICSPSSPIKCYAAWSNDTDIRKKCSSGGIGFEISRTLLLEGYKACVVFYNTQSGRSEHYIASNTEELNASIGSKYLQSYTLNALKKIDKKDKYLITGTPCQIDSFRRYIRKFKIEENFILMDFFCHGVPSMWSWINYKKMVEKRTGNFTRVEWRNKETGWHDSWCMKIDGEQNSYISKATKGDIFYQLFLRNACLNKACYSKCKYKYNNSSADIRIGDLWGEYYKDNQEGVSALVALTKKGYDVINTIKSIEKNELPFSVVAEGQIQHRLKEPTIARMVTLGLLKRKIISIRLIVLIMKVCLKLFK